MNQINAGKSFDRLTRRREELVTTLRHLYREQKLVENNTDWLDQAAYESRVSLLDRLNDWYITEIAQIERALDRIRCHTYGMCVACHQPIVAARLAAAPEADYCAGCQETREALAYA